jgi:hypothetical protein
MKSTIPSSVVLTIADRAKAEGHRGVARDILLFLAMILPFFLAASVRTMDNIVQIDGLAAVPLLFLPAVVQIVSKRMMMKEWHTAHCCWWARDILVFPALFYGRFTIAYALYDFPVSLL